MAESKLRKEDTAEYFNAASQGRLPGTIGVEILEIGRGQARGRIALQPFHMAPNGFLHAATVIGLADTLCGYGCVASLPEGATGFTTVETKSNHLGTAREGSISGIARLAHAGSLTQVWDADVIDDATGKTITLFRCTHMVLYPKA
jgi:1,4-dihydroxy-2-naphthoyl-CoA hydrolase